MIFHFLPETFWIPLAVVLISGHLTSISSSLYLHRSMTHKGVIFAAPISFLMRLWLWMATSINTKEWVACHRKHHAFPDQEEDPHSPYQTGFFRVLFGGVFQYRKAIADKDMVEKFGKGCPNDWLERNLFEKYKNWGVLVIAIADVALFGFAWGAAVWVGQILWMINIGHIVNAAGHKIGYRNTDVDDHSTNIIPIGIIIAGEELHNNHHANPASPKFSRKWYEFDMGWMYIKLLSMVNLANVRYSTTK